MGFNLKIEPLMSPVASLPASSPLQSSAKPSPLCKSMVCAGWAAKFGAGLACSARVLRGVDTSQMCAFPEPDMVATAAGL